VARDERGYAKYRRNFELGIESVVRRGPAAQLSPHAHEQYQLTLYGAGQHRFEIGGRSLQAGTGGIVVITSGEPHASGPVDDQPLSLRGFYIDVAPVVEAARSIWRGSGAVAFREPLVRDEPTVARVYAAHCALERGGLEAEVALCEALKALVGRHAEPTGPARPLTGAEARVARARDLIADRIADSVRLDELAEAAGVSRFHLIRLFRQQYGVTPFAYQRNARVERARQVLSRGGTIADAVTAGGFADQSHLGRLFMAVRGVTPGQYRRSFAASTARASGSPGTRLNARRSRP